MNTLCGLEKWPLRYRAVFLVNQSDSYNLEFHHSLTSLSRNDCQKIPELQYYQRKFLSFYHFQTLIFLVFLFEAIKRGVNNQLALIFILQQLNSVRVLLPFPCGRNSQPIFYNFTVLSLIIFSLELFFGLYLSFGILILRFRGNFAIKNSGTL